MLRLFCSDGAPATKICPGSGCSLHSPLDITVFLRPSGQEHSLPKRMTYVELAYKEEPIMSVFGFGTHFQLTSGSCLSVHFIGGLEPIFPINHSGPTVATNRRKKKQQNSPSDFVKTNRAAHFLHAVTQQSDHIKGRYGSRA